MCGKQTLLGGLLNSYVTQEVPWNNSETIQRLSMICFPRTNKTVFDHPMPNQQYSRGMLLCLPCLWEWILRKGMG